MTDFRHRLLNLINETAKTKPREWNPALLAITEGRRSGIHRYDWSGDLVTSILAKAGIESRALNRKAVSGTHAPGMTRDLLLGWAGELGALDRVATLLGNEFNGEAWHEWDDEYVPQCGDILVHTSGLLEMMIEQTPKGIRVLAPMVFAEARILRRNFGHFELRGAIDVSRFVEAS